MDVKNELRKIYDALNEHRLKLAFSIGPGSGALSYYLTDAVDDVMESIVDLFQDQFPGEKIGNED